MCLAYFTQKCTCNQVEYNLPICWSFFWTEYLAFLTTQQPNACSLCNLTGNDDHRRSWCSRFTEVIGFVPPALAVHRISWANHMSIRCRRAGSALGHLDCQLGSVIHLLRLSVCNNAIGIGVLGWGFFYSWAIALWRSTVEKKRWQKSLS